MVVLLVLSGGLLVLLVGAERENRRLGEELAGLRSEVRTPPTLAPSTPPRELRTLPPGAQMLSVDLEDLSEADRQEVPVVLTNPVALAMNDPEQMANQSLARFDRSLDREFQRLESRVARSNDPEELAMIERMKEAFTELDALWIAVDSDPSPSELPGLRNQIQSTMSEVIRLGRQDRNDRLTALAREIGYTEEASIRMLIEEVDRIYRETHLDWTQLFHRSPPGGVEPRMPADQRPGSPAP
ncbi:MAG TPA: hypothetical protein PKE55_12630 [Kiritimatiellia bacterium]|nr:hypothetical protein [Kiritimatiellia bacterium]